MKRITVLRIDDVCPCMDWFWFDKTMELLNKHNITGMLGVIPDCRDSSLNVSKADPLFWDKMKEYQKNGWYIAMHGYQHLYDTKATGCVISERDKESEFAGHQYKEQLCKILDGKKILESNGIETDAFFAPSHNYDKNTVKALNKAGFRYMADGRSKFAYTWKNIKFIPNCRAKEPREGIYTIVLHPCMTKEKGYEGLIKRIEERGEIIVPFQDALSEQLWPAKSRCSFLQLLCERVYVNIQRLKVRGAKLKKLLTDK